VVVIRPDSGDPETVCLKLVKILHKKFGAVLNSKGFFVLNNVRLIQGDGINERTIRNILGSFAVHGYSADNIAFGMGGALLQQVDRDTQKFAMKCSSVQINGEWQDVMKDPITDSGKKSKAGRVTLWSSGKDFQSAVSQPKAWTDQGMSWTEALVPVYWNGNLHREYTFEEVRANAKK
jgi:nicotinamide phosphoribosyltransferase